MENVRLIERAKMVLQLLGNGVHPVTGEKIVDGSVFTDERVQNCFSFIIQTLDDYLELSERVEQLENEKEENTVVIAKKQAFSITSEQCDQIGISKEPLSVLSFMKRINSVIDAGTMEKLTSTRLTKWLIKRGYLFANKVPTVVQKTAYTVSESAFRIGITEETTVDPRSGELKTQFKLGESAQMFILENMEEIVSSTSVKRKKDTP